MIAALTMGESVSYVGGHTSGLTAVLASVPPVATAAFRPVPIPGAIRLSSGIAGGGGAVQSAGPALVQGPSSEASSGSLFGLPRVAVIGGGAAALLLIAVVGIKLARR